MERICDGPFDVHLSCLLGLFLITLFGLRQINVSEARYR